MRVKRPVREVRHVRGTTYQIHSLSVLEVNLMPKNPPKKIAFVSGQGKTQIVGIVRILARQAAKDEYQNQIPDHKCKGGHNDDYRQNPYA